MYNVKQKQSLISQYKAQRLATNHQESIVYVMSKWRIKVIPNSNINVSHYFTDGEEEVKIYSAKFSHDDKYIAAGIAVNDM